MANKLNCVLLIDDDEPTNYFNEMILEDAECAENVITVTGGSDALDYLRLCAAGKETYPDVIFLDINMPGMNGWEFLEEYEKLDFPEMRGVVVVMLTTSLNPDDEARAMNIDDVKKFMIKPMSVDGVHQIVKELFPRNN